MNPIQLLMSQLQTQLKASNPASFNQFQQMLKGNPQEILDNMMGKYSPEQKQNFVKFAKGFGLTDEQLNQVGINTK